MITVSRCAGSGPVAMPSHDESSDVQRQQAQERKRNAVIEADDRLMMPPLAGDVESAEARVDQRQQRG